MQYGFQLSVCFADLHNFINSFSLQSKKDVIIQNRDTRERAICVTCRIDNCILRSSGVAVNVLFLTVPTCQKHAYFSNLILIVLAS